MRLIAPAKINWTLEILGRRPDGYHEIDSVMQTISLADEIEMLIIPEAECRIRCDDPTVPVDSSNLVARAWRLLRDANRERVKGIEIRLTKRIPAGAGLGGGSSDAAAALKGLNVLFDLNLGEAQLEESAARIGSDVAFFIRGGAARVQGRGEIVRPIERDPAMKQSQIHGVLVWPGFASPTAKAYGSLTPEDFASAAASAESASDRAERALRGGDARRLLDSMSNTFDNALARKDDHYLRLKARMRVAGIARPMLSGSGSACFGFAENAGRARSALERLVRDYPATHVIQVEI